MKYRKKGEEIYIMEDLQDWKNLGINICAQLHKKTALKIMTHK
jgi:hypothetical protein